MCNKNLCCIQLSFYFHIFNIQFVSNIKCSHSYLASSSVYVARLEERHAPTRHEQDNGFGAKPTCFFCVILKKNKSFNIVFRVQTAGQIICQYEDLYPLGSLGVLSPLCILELNRQHSKNTTIIVIYKMFVYIQMSQPTTCFGLFQLGHLQVGYLSQRKYTIVVQHYCIFSLTQVSNLKMA